MTSVRLNSVSYHYADNAVENISFTANQGSITAIVGASGSGKTTILHLIAGFLQPKIGKIFIADSLVASPSVNLPAKDRSIGLVFQNHALLPHMNVRKNIEFGMASRPHSEKIRLETIMRELRIEKLADKYPFEISGGESQRVSLARAMAANAKIFLMDEPFSSIDPVFRRELRNDMIRFLRKPDRTTVIVTHDAEEALELADHIIVLDQGEILQQGSAFDIYFNPKHLQVAQLFGDVNHIEGHVLVKALTGKDEDEVFLRPELLRLNDPNGIHGRIIHIAYRGNYSLVSAVIEGERCLKVKTTNTDYKVGQEISLGRLAR